MASIQELKTRIDLHDLAEKLGLQKPKGQGNYRSPHHKDNMPSLSIFNGGRAFKDHSAGDTPHSKGSFLDLIMYVEGLHDEGEALRRAHEIYNIPFDAPQRPAERRERTKVEWIAEQCAREPAAAVSYLTGRGVAEAAARAAVQLGAVGFNTWTSPKAGPGEVGHGGPAVAFIARDLHSGLVRAVDFRYLDPALNGGLKTKSTGDKDGVPWVMHPAALRRAHTIVVVESAINALCVESLNKRGWAALALRGIGAVDGIDWRLLQGKQVILALDADTPDEKGRRPGPQAAWHLYDLLSGLNVAAMMVDQASWYADQLNDVADIAQARGLDDLRERLESLEPWAIPGLPGKDSPGGRSRVFLPAHDFAVYWRFRTKPDFTTYIEKVEQSEDGMDQLKVDDVCGFRVAALSRVTIQSATATMTGEADHLPTTMFSVSVQTPRHGATLVRRVLSDDRLHNAEQWAKFGPIFKPARFLRLVNILERTAECGAREALNFVGLAWRAGRPVLNEGPDCYFTEPEKQCPYHNLQFPSGQVADARRVIGAYQDTFRDNAAAMLLVWALGAHLKAFLGFWPHMTMEAQKGSGKSTLVKRLERTLGFTMFGGQSLQTEFRLITSVSHTSHPVGWEEISARKQEVINTAVAMLQESYQYTITRRGSDMTEFLICAPVLLAGEDVPVDSLIGKLVRTDLSHRKGPEMAQTLPAFPVREWLQWLTALEKSAVLDGMAKWEGWLWDGCLAHRDDNGAARMVRNYAAVATAWALLCFFADVPAEQGGFLRDLRAGMNAHIKETKAAREPWVWIVEIALSDIVSGQFLHPHVVADVDGERCLLIRVQHVMDHISSTPRLKEKYNALPVKSARAFRKQLDAAGVVHKDDVDRRIQQHRHAHLTALSLEKLAEFGLYLPEHDDTGAPAPYGRAANE